MKTLELARKELNLKEFVRRTALESDCTTLINSDVLVTEGGEPRILYKTLDFDTDELKWAVKRIKFHTAPRTSGLMSTSRVFGYSPRNAIRRDYCSATGMASQHPAEHAVICAFGQQVAELYEMYFPDVFTTHERLVNERVLPGWKLANCPFTSGIVNKNNPLKYHFDAGNIKDVLSNMIVFKHRTRGGYLACPEFDIHLEAADNTVVLFDGQSILHGVTPIKNLSVNSWRYSIVYYTLQQMWSCLPVTEEATRIRKVHLERERRRAKGDALTNK